MARAHPRQRCRARLGRPGAARRRQHSPSRARPEHERARGLARHPAAPAYWSTIAVSPMRGSCSKRPASATSFVPMPLKSLRMPCSAAGCCSSNPDAATVSAMTPSCWRRRARRARANGSWISGRAWARPDWRSRSAWMTAESRWSRSIPVSPRWQRRMRKPTDLPGGSVPSCSTSRRRRVPSPQRGSRLNR